MSRGSALTCGPSTRKARCGPVPHARGNCRSMTTLRSGPGVTWTAASTRPTCMRAFLACNAASMAWCRSRCRGRNRVRGSRGSSSAWSSTCWVNATLTGATKILRISWDEAWGMMERAVKRGRQRKVAKVVRRIGVDEKAAAKGHRYLTLVCDLEEGTVEHIAEDRKQESLDGYYQGLSKKQLAGIEAVAMDMWEPYIQATLARVPEAAGKIVFDRFHVMGYLGKAVDTVRKQEHRELMASGDETLKGSKYLWLYSQENVPERRRDEFDALRRKALKVGRAWAIKEALRRLWHYVYPDSGWKFWKRWYFWATHSRLESIRKAAETVRRHIDNILT